jgi:hypothetical protein
VGATGREEACTGRAFHAKLEDIKPDSRSNNFFAPTKKSTRSLKTSSPIPEVTTGIDYSNNRRKKTRETGYTIRDVHRRLEFKPQKDYNALVKKLQKETLQKKKAGSALTIPKIDGTSPWSLTFNINKKKVVCSRLIWRSGRCKETKLRSIHSRPQISGFIA